MTGRLIALTGGIATGKSTVATLLGELGAVVVDADLLAREVVAPGSDGLSAVVAALGSRVLAADGSLDRPVVAAMVFADAARRRTLEGITHPRIHALLQERVAAALRGDAPLVVADIPLLYERGLDTGFAAVLLVAAPPEVQRLRLAQRDGLGADAAQQRLDAQLSIDDKRERATWIIDNSGTPAQTADQVRRWWEQQVGSR